MLQVNEEGNIDIVKLTAAFVTSRSDKAEEVIDTCLAG